MQVPFVHFPCGQERDVRRFHLYTHHPFRKECVRKFFMQYPMRSGKGPE